ncbi:MAG: transposase [Anaerolineales bacterium]
MGGKCFCTWRWATRRVTATGRTSSGTWVRRGLNTPVLITTDGAPGLIRAIEENWPDSLRQRCLAHKTRNVLDKVLNDVRAEVRAMVQSAYYAPNRRVGEMIAQDLLDRHEDQYPSAMKAFTEDLEAC